MALDIPNNKEIFRQRDVRETPTAILTDGEKVPVGAILPWLKSFTGTPSIPLGYVECDGAVLNDPESVYDGATIPDLNGGEFLRGFTTSGGTGGSTAHTHALTSARADIGGNNNEALVMNLAANASWTPNKYYDTGGITGSSPGASGYPKTTISGDTDGGDGTPPYYNVVWIIRIK